jgi:adenylate cyclase
VLQRVERKLAAIVAADVAGYSRLMGVDEVGTARRLREHQAVVSRIVREHSGRVVNVTGDGMLFEFSSVVGAVHCAVAVQQQMSLRNSGLVDDQRMLLRVGIDVGDVLIEGDDILGEGVNIAARLEGIAQPGGICLSGAVYEQSKGKVNFEFIDLDEQRLKNIAEPVQVYSVRLNGNGSVSFGDGAQGKVPSASSNIVATYRRGAGIVGAVAVLVVIVVGGVVRH